MKILITGTPGAGKTTVAKALAKKLKWFTLIDLNQFAEENGCVSGTDKKRKAKIIDEKKLAKEIAKLKGNFIIEGHLAHLVAKKGDVVFVLRCNVAELRKRLQKKGWSKGKLQENVDAEIMQVILEEAKEKKGAVEEIDSSGNAKETALNILEALNARHLYKPASEK